MSKVKFGTNEYEAKWIESSHDYIEGSDRQVLTVQIGMPTDSLDSFNEMLSNEANTGVITVVNEDTGVPGSVAMQTFDGFVLRQKLAVEPVAAGFDDDTGVPIVEDRVIIKMARRSALELQVAQLTEMMKNAGLLS